MARTLDGPCSWVGGAESPGLKTPLCAGVNGKVPAWNSCLGAADVCVFDIIKVHWPQISHRVMHPISRDWGFQKVLLQP